MNQGVEVARKPQKRMAVILFIDIIGSSELSNVLSFEEYDKLVWSFQSVVKEVVCSHVLENEQYKNDSCRKCESSVRGDEICVIFYSDVPPKEEAKYERQDIVTTLRLAIDIKRKWLCSKFNFDRIQDGKSIVDLGIGINCGYVIVDKHWRISGNNASPEETAEGYAINLAKRIETYSRTGMYSKIFVSRSVYNILRIDFQIAFSKAHMTAFKGIIQQVPVYEIKSFGHVEDTAFAPALTSPEETIYRKAVEHNPHELWLILDLAHHHFDKEEYFHAVHMYKLALEVDPEFSPAHMYLGRSYYRDFNDQQASIHLERARELNPDSARANNFLGVCLRRLAYRAKHSSKGPGGIPETEWRDYYRRALAFHRIAMRITEPDQYIWAYNAYAMTLAQAIHENALWDHYPSKGEKDHALNEAQKRVDCVFKKLPKFQNYLFHHVKGFVLAVRENLKKANFEFSTAVSLLRNDYKVSPKKYREKMAEICFHRGLLNIQTVRTGQYQKAICEAYIGDLLRREDEEKNFWQEAEKDERKIFLSQQYWFEKVRADLQADEVDINQMLESCEQCIRNKKLCGEESQDCDAQRPSN